MSATVEMDMFLILQTTLPAQVIFSVHNIATVQSLSRNNSVDVDECEDDHNTCSHYCNNTEGSYQCSCPSGYILNDSDGSTCLGMLASSYMSSA